MAEERRPPHNILRSKYNGYQELAAHDIEMRKIFDRISKDPGFNIIEDNSSEAKSTPTVDIDLLFLRPSEVITLSPRDFIMLGNLVNKPSEPNEALKNAFARHSK